MDRFRSFIDEVRNRTDIADIVAADVELRESGSVLKGLSPFHVEARPSFVVWPRTQTWHDFSNGGGRGGDVFSYVQEREGCSFKEALYSLAAQSGVRAPRESSEDLAQEIAHWEERREVERILSLATAYYHHVLPSKIRETWYRTQYGLRDETVDELLLGWADGHLYDHLTTRENVTREQALQTGLFVQLGDGRVEDFFQSRLVFPYWKGGRVVYLIARSTEFTGDEAWEQPKYKKLPLRSSKHPYISSTLRNDYFYNEDAARSAGELLVTEGITDCIAAMQAGIPCISPATTRFRDQDLPKLLALAKPGSRVVICNDSEESGAGEAGALETADALTNASRHVHLIKLPRASGIGKIDLNDYLKAHTADDLRALMAQAPSYPRYLLDRLPVDTPMEDLERQLAPVLKATAACGPLVQDALLRVIVQRHGVKLRTLQALLRQHAPVERVSAPQLRDAPDERSTTKRLDSTASLEPLRGEIQEALDFYYIQHKNTIERISSFTVEPTECIRGEDGEYIKADLLTIRGERFHGVTFPPSAWRTRRDFLSALPSPRLQWTGNDNNVQGLLQRLTGRDVPVRKGISTLGYIELPDGPRWLAPDIVITKDGFRETDSVVYHAGKKPARLARSVRYLRSSPDEVRAGAREILPLLLELNEPMVLLPILAWFFAVPFRPRIKEKLGRFPILFVWGTQGSGKTSIIKDVFWPLAGITRHTNPFSATQTDFAMIRCLETTNSVPVFIDEYKPSDMPKQSVDRLHRLLRRVAGGETEERGRPDQSIVEYELNAPVCMAGESWPEDDKALKERALPVTPSKHSVAHARYRAAFEQLSRIDLNLLATPYIQFALTRDTSVDLDSATAAARRICAEVPNAEMLAKRDRDNLDVMIFGLTMFEAFAESLGIPLPELDVITAVTQLVQLSLDAGSASKDAFDRFMEDLTAYALMGALEEGRHYAMVNGLLCIHLGTCYQVYLTERRRAGLEDKTNGLPALRRIIREKQTSDSYVVQMDKRVYLGKQFVRTIALDLTKVPEKLTIDEFPITGERTWGRHHKEEEED
jgi:DNA primase catalytic core